MHKHRFFLVGLDATVPSMIVPTISASFYRCCPIFGPKIFLAQSLLPSSYSRILDDYFKGDSMKNLVFLGMFSLASVGWAQDPHSAPSETVVSQGSFLIEGEEIEFVNYADFVVMRISDFTEYSIQPADVVHVTETEHGSKLIVAKRGDKYAVLVDDILFDYFKEEFETYLQTGHWNQCTVAGTQCAAAVIGDGAFGGLTGSTLGPAGTTIGTIGGALGGYGSSSACTTFFTEC